ncbi:MAG TPA: CHRD domain-containing protein [Candidatus Deferrimicrobiaceae bacterium]
MRKVVWSLFGIFVVAAFVATGTSWANKMHGEKVKVKLAAVPSVKTSAGGEADFALAKDGKTIHFRLDLKKIENVTMAHVHAVGADGTPAAILTWLYPPGGDKPSLREGKLSGKLSEGDITDANLLGPMKGKAVKELFEQIKNGTAGVAVHTKQNGGGELWGIHKEAKKESKNEMNLDEPVGTGSLGY